MDERSEHRPASRDASAGESAVAVLSAYGAFRLVLALLALWSFFGGFALFTGFDALGLGGGDTAERVAGAHMIMLAPVYGILAWRREQYRLLLWVPYAAQLAIVLPILWELFFDGDVDGPLMLIISLIFLALLVYVWLSSHPTEFFSPSPAEADEEPDVVDEPDEGPDEPQRGRRYRRTG